MTSVRALFRPRILLAIVAVAGLLAVALWPRATPVDVATADYGPLRVTIDEEGETRIRHRFVVSTPVAGRVLRIDLEPGDRVKRGDTIAEVRPELPALLDARSRSEAEAAVAAARAAVGRVQADEARAKTSATLAQRELARARQLLEAGAVAQQELDIRESDADAANEQVRAARFATAAAEAELAQARARLRPATSSPPGIVTVQAPIDGVILKRLRESESVVPGGEGLVEIGDFANLEIVSDLLSTDAVRVSNNARVLIVEWGGEHELEARVRRVEPSGFTKISALGVEEQRVNVLMEFQNPVDVLAELGDAYRVEVRIVTWESDRVLKVPTSAMFREGEAWAVYVIENGRVRRTPIEVGHRSGQEAEVTSGLSEGSIVVVHPPDTLQEGARVTARERE
jgi:HlyD family secretion protein